MRGNKSGGVESVLMRRRLANSIYRMMDANANRASEGLRVAEDIFRFSLGDSSLSASARKIRHDISHHAIELVARHILLTSRDSEGDPGAGRYSSSHQRQNLEALLTANLRRAQESARVLEECARLLGKNTSVRQFQSDRYALYTLEKRAGEILGLRHRRK